MTRAGRAIMALPRRVGGWVRRTWRASPLRVRLVAVLAVLVAVALGGSGIAAAATMGSYLVGRVDAGLRSAAGPLAAELLGGSVAPGAAGGPAQSGSGVGASLAGDDGHRRLPSVYVVEMLDAAGVVVAGPTSNLIDPHQPLPDLPHPSVREVAAHRARPFTVGSAQGDGHWRVLASPTTLADGKPGTLLTAPDRAEPGWRAGNGWAGSWRCC